MIAGTTSSQLALPFFMEQMRIEKYYFYYIYSDLAPVFFSIGQIYKKHDMLVEAKQYFTDALSLLTKHNRKGRLYASLIYNTVLIEYRWHFYKDTLKNFDITIAEYHAAYGDFHPFVVETYIQVGNFQLEIGKLQHAMNNFLKAMMIIRMNFGNDHIKIAECLFGIGLIYEARSEHKKSLKVLQRAFIIIQGAEDDDDDDNATFLLVILHRIGLIYQSAGDIDRANALFEDLKNIIKSKSRNHDAKAKLFKKFGLDVNENNAQTAAAA